MDTRIIALFVVCIICIIFSSMSGYMTIPSPEPAPDAVSHTSDEAPDSNTQINGCMNTSASNYNPDADVSDNSCIFSGCTNELADNYDSNANQDDGSCFISGCTNELADNYDSNANQDDGSCLISGCTNELADNYDSNANQDDGSCLLSGCDDPTADNYSEYVNNPTNEMCEYTHTVDNYTYENSRYSKNISTVPDNISIENAFPFKPDDKLAPTGYYYNTIKTTQYDNNHPCKQTGDYNFVDLLECAKPDLTQCVELCNKYDWCTGFTTNLGQNVAKDGHPLYCTFATNEENMDTIGKLVPGDTTSVAYRKP